MFKPIYEFFTSPLGLPIEWYYEYAIMAVIDLIAYGIAYRKVGDLFSDGWISGRSTGSFFHWIIRAILVIAMWAITYGVIWLGKILIANWQIILMSAGSIVGAFLICILTIAIMRKIKRHRTVNVNG